MEKWTGDELALAIKLTSRHGYDFDQAARIMGRNGYPGRSGSDIRKKIKESAPKAWKKISEAYETRQSVKIAGVPASPPKRRFNVLPDNFIKFFSNIPAGLTDGEACWVARLAGFDCNITDIAIAAKRCGYDLSSPETNGIDYSDAIEKDLCVWPIGDGACGKARAKGRYCGAHHCRSLGRIGRG